MVVKKCAFTLAEVLITLVIIGVVAALTIPNLMQKYQEQTTVKKVQKFYSNLSNAYSLAMKENGPANEWGITGLDTASAEKVYEMLFKPYFKIAKNCGTASTGTCLANVNYKFLNNTESGSYYNRNTNYYKISLDDGATAVLRGLAPTNGGNIYVFYDVNGVKEPNQWGRDIFEFHIRADKVFPSGLPSGAYSVAPFNNNCQLTNSGYGCAAWLIYKGNMDYLHCTLTWDKNSCKDK